MNRLAHEKSPYLLQHKDNPVDWFPWGTEAFEKAQAEDKPIFLSIGYSTCHWCHVMAHESFENPEIASLLNRDFICIKLDREERPDVDRLYMGFVQATTGSGGWPLSVWLTPQGAPFFGGTYFPPEDRHGRVGFPVLLTRIQEAWHARREDLLNHAHKAMDALRESSAPMDSSSPIQGNPLLSGFQAFVQTFDETRGGFGQAPKFPRPSVFRFLFRCSQSLPEKESAYAQEMALFSLREMGRGGIRDHLGGGFHRYSVDSQWHVPHFEKMLYDQAQLVSCFVDAFQITKDPFFEELTTETFDYLLRDLAHKDGGFFSAEDADSKDASGQSTEGAYYVWSYDEICNALTEREARMICRFYAISPQGNAPSEGDPMGEFDEKNILKQSLSIEEIAEEEKISVTEAKEILTHAKQTLFTLRSKRKRPHLDDKILTAWNGLALSALARAGACFGNKEWITHAEKTAQFLHTHLYDTQTRMLYRSWREGRSDILGFAEDYAFLIQGLLDLYEATFQFHWLQWALDLQETLDKHFKDEVHGGYFNNLSGDALMPMRLKEDYDGAEPAANSVAASNLLRLARMFYAETWEKAAQDIFSAFAQPLSLVPQGLPEMLSSFAFAQSPPAQVIFIGDPNHTDFQRLTQRTDQEFSPFRVALAMTNATNRETLSSRLPQLAEMKAVDGHATAYFCENFTCRAPIVEK